MSPIFCSTGVPLGIIGGILLQNLVQELAIVIGQFVEAAPARLVRGNGIIFAPRAARILIEVLAWVNALVHGAQVKRLGPRDSLFSVFVFSHGSRGSRRSKVFSSERCRFARRQLPPSGQYTLKLRFQSIGTLKLKFHKTGKSMPISQSCTAEALVRDWGASCGKVAAPELTVACKTALLHY